MTPNDLITITQAAALRRKLGSPLSRNAIYKAIKAGKLKTFTLPVCGERPLVSRAEIEAYQAIGHKHGIYGDGKTLLEIAAEEMHDDPKLEVVEIFRRITERGIAVKRSLLCVVLATDAKRKNGRFKRTKHGSYALVQSDHKPKGYKHNPLTEEEQS